MAYPAGYSSDEDDLDEFLSDHSNDLEDMQVAPAAQQLNAPQELSREQKLNGLFFAIMNGNVESVISLLDQGIEVNAEIRDGWTAILLAASVGASHIVHELINRGADVNGSRDKYTVLMAACSCPQSTAPASKCLEVVIQLIAKGADVDAITRTRKTAIMFAASNGNVEVVRKLLSCCNAKAEDNQGWDALFWAVNDNKPEVVQVLLDAGFNLYKFDVRGNTAAFYAATHEDVMKILPLEAENIMTNVQESSYQIETLFNDQQPQFYRDVYCMLYGMKCEQLANTFANISLLDFLSLNEVKLLKLGVAVPYQRNRILTGLHKYHKHLYKQSSIPIVTKNSIYSTVNVAEALVSAIRQLISMEASIRYISYSIIDNENKEPFHIMIIKNRIAKLKKTATTLQSLTQNWDSSNRPVDLITKNTKKPSPRWIKWFAYFSSISLVAFTAGKVRNHW